MKSINLSNRQEYESDEGAATVRQRFDMKITRDEKIRSRRTSALQHIFRIESRERLGFG